jgi:6-pyruvoyl-tetrahydropterin synthase
MTSWVIHSRSSFQASHALTVYQGRPEASHRHDWEVAIRVGAGELNDEGFAIDFHAVHELLEGVVRPLDGSDLNSHPTIGAPTPTAERVAEFIASAVAPGLAALGGTLLTVSVWEGPENRVDLELG